MTKQIARALIRSLIGVSLLLQAGLSSAAEGSFDPTFGNGGRLLVTVTPYGDDEATRMVLRPDGKLLLAGNCRYPDPVTPSGTKGTFCLTQLLASGSYDRSFGPGGVGYLEFDHFASWPRDTQLADTILLQDGRIALIGSAFATNGAVIPSVLIGVLLADGSALDATVGAGNGYLQFQFGGKSSYAASLVQQSDGKIVIAGTAVDASGNEDFGVARLLANFSGLDTTFGSSGSQTVVFDLGGPSGDNSDIAEAARLQSNGKIVLAGYAVASAARATPQQMEFALVRLNVDGSRDTTFGTAGDGRLTYLAGEASVLPYVDAKIDAGDRIVLGGGGVATASATSQDWIIDRLTRDGARDATFNGGSPQLFAAPPGNGGSVTHLALTSDGIFAIGNTPRTPGTNPDYFGVARLNANGVFDPRFGNNGRLYGSFTATGDVNTTGVDIAVGKSGLMVFGTQSQQIGANDGTFAFGIGRLQYDQIFANDFGLNVTLE